MPKVTMGRIVHYFVPHDHGAFLKPAIVLTDGRDDPGADPFAVQLQVFGQGLPDAHTFPHATLGMCPGQWRWPPRV